MNLRSLCYKIWVKLSNFTYEIGRVGKRIQYPSEILSAEAGNDLLKNMLVSEKPFMASRFGANEINYAYRKIHKLRIPYKFRRAIATEAGVFPVDDEKTMFEFSKTYLDSARDVDFLGVWNASEYSGAAITEFCPKAILAPLISLEPYYFKNPYSAALSEKTVLVIHPFSESIKTQYQKRRFLFKTRDVLPDFNLITFKTEITCWGHDKFANWFEALKFYCDKISKIDFDVAIVGCGSYGMPLASFIKRAGKQAIHIGGATQILFGIKGKRWDKRETISKLYNPYWIRPAPSETPVNKADVEGGCYW